MHRTACVVGVIGGDDSSQNEAARQIGEAIVRTGQIILTGGQPKNTKDVKDAVLWGATESVKQTDVPDPLYVRFIGILKSPPGIVDWNVRDYPCGMILKTGLSSFERDPLNGLTPDSLIVFRGGRGTLCELAYAAIANKPIRYYGSIKQLRMNAEEHRRDGVLETVFNAALQKYSLVDGKLITFSDLLGALMSELNAAQQDDLSVDEIVRASVENAFQGKTELGPTGFPGLWGNLALSKSSFESVVDRISRCERRA